MKTTNPPTPCLEAEWEDARIRFDRLVSTEMRPTNKELIHHTRTGPGQASTLVGTFNEQGELRRLVWIYQRGAYANRTAIHLTGEEVQAVKAWL